MKAKRFFLISDISVQLLLAFTAIFIQFNKPHGNAPFGINENAFICFYFVFGGWQVLSYLVHAIIYRNVPNALRNVYGMVLLMHVGMPFLGFAGLFILLCTSPIMGVYYFIICLTDLMNTYDEQT